MVVTIPGFEVGRLLGKGGMGEVYEARDTRSSRPAAVKVLLPEHTSAAGRNRFEREARAMLSVDHPNVCAAYDYGSLDDGRLYLAMELLEGEDLAVRLNREVYFAADVAVEIAAQVAAALARTHARGVLHRDIKPSNLFLTETPTGGVHVKVLDFGLAVVAGLGDAGRVTRTGEIVGTPAYMSPEQARGRRDLDERADVYALGAVLYHMLTGRPPYGKDAPLAILVRMLTESVPPVREVRPGVPGPLDALVSQMLLRDVEARPARMVDVVQALRSFNAEELAYEPTDGLEFANTQTRPGDADELASERRLLTALVAAGVDRVDAVVAAIQAHGGQAVDVGPQDVVGLFGAEELEGDEALRAVRAAHDAQDMCRVVGVSTGWTGVSDQTGAVESAWAATVQLGRGVVLDDETRSRVGSRVSVKDGRVLSVTGDTPVPQVYLPLVGRDADLATLGAKARQAFEDEEPGGILVLGPPGVGKTRLIQELMASLRESEDLTAVVGAAEPHRRYSSWYTIGAAMRDLAGISEDTPAPRAREVMRSLAVEAGLDTDVGELLAVTFGVDLPEGGSPAIEHARRDPQAMREQVFSALGDYLEARSEQRPLLLVLEDAQWADTPSLEFVDVLLRRARRGALYVVVTGRPHALEERRDILGSGMLAEHVLRDLSNRAARRLVEEALLRHGVSELVGAVAAPIAEHAGGNPFFVSEIVQSVALRFRSDGLDGFDPDAFVLPMTVEGAVQSRLDHLSATDKDLVKRASVFGPRFWVEALDELGCQAPTPSLRRLTRGGLVLRPARRDVRLSGFDEYEFRQRVVRDVAYGTLTRQQQRGLHLAAGRWLSLVDSAPPEETAAHLDRGGDHPAAAEWWARAAEAALLRGDTQVAVQWFDRAIGRLQDEFRVAELRLKKVEACYAGNDFREVEAELAAIDVAALEPILAVKARYWRYQLALATAPNPDARREAAAQMLEVADTFGHLGLGYWQTVSLSKAAITRHYLGESPGLPVAARALEVAGDDKAAQAKAYDALAMVHIYDDALDQAHQACAAGVDAARLGGSLGMEVAMLGDLAWIAAQLGRFDEAKTALEEVIQRAPRIGNRLAGAYAMHNLGLVHLNRGALDEALSVEQEALRMAQAGENDRLVAYCQVYRAFILLALDRPVDAATSASAAFGFARGTELEAAARTALASARAAKGEVVDALAEAERADALRVESGRMVEFSAELTVVLVQLLRQVGRLDEATTRLESAQSALKERAGRLAPTPDGRTAFLAIPAHRSLLELTA